MKPFKAGIIISMLLWGTIIGSNAQAANPPYDNFAAVLKTYVNQEGMVDYRGLKANPQQLNAFVAALGQIFLLAVVELHRGRQIQTLLGVCPLSLNVIRDAAIAVLDATNRVIERV